MGEIKLEMANVIPMAGLGSRFKKEEFNVPKPLIRVSGKPMVIQAIKHLPKTNKWIFIVRKEHIEQHSIDKIIKKEIPKAIIISVDKTTEGQACTCLLAEKYLDPEEELYIAPCDSTFLFDKEKFKQTKDKNDAVFFTTTKNEVLRKTPNSWGWYRLENDKTTIKDISIKIPVSNDPFNDHAVTATFYFKKAKDFINSAKLMIKENYRINNEFYVDSLPLFLKKLGKKSVIFDVDLYVSWNKPEDLKEFEKIESTIKNYSEKSLTGEKKKQIRLWRKYFKK